MGRMYQKLALCGGEGGSEWDDDVYEGVKKAYVGQDLSRITYVKFEYVKEDGEVVTREYGTITQDPREFVVNFMEEHITSVEATYDNPKLFRNTVITSLKFETSKGRTAVFGYEMGKKFVLGHNGDRLLGFHGKEGEAIDALGAYFEHIPDPTPPPVIGDSWTDYDSYDGVKKIKIGLYEEGVAFLKFVYIKGNDLVTGDDHGKITSLGAEEIVLEDGEYLKGIEGYYRRIEGASFRKIVSIKFKTNRRETPMYGLDSGEKYGFEAKDYKITGFSGRATDVIYDISPISRPIS